MTINSNFQTGEDKMTNTTPTVTFEEYVNYMQGKGFDELRAFYVITNSMLLRKVEYDPKSGSLTASTVAPEKPQVKRYTLRDDRRGFNSVAAAGD
jgi:hypothetical protein